MSPRSSLAQRLARRSLPTSTGCLEWRGARDPEGYGIVKVDGAARRVHRVVWSLGNGPIPSGLVVMHQCDNPPCIRPDHLTVGTQADNVRDSLRKKRRPQNAERKAA